MKSKRGKERVQGKEKNLNKMRKIRILYSDPYATDYSSEEEELFLRNEYQLDGSKRFVKEIFVPFMPLAYENKKNEFESSLLAFKKKNDAMASKAANDINDINGLVKEENIKELTSGEKGVCNKEDISNVASLVGHDLYFCDEMEMMLDDEFCNFLDNEIGCDPMWKIENYEDCSILPPVDCVFSDPELGWIDETLNWDCH